MRITDEIGKEIMFDTTEDKGRSICPRSNIWLDMTRLVCHHCEGVIGRMKWRRMQRMVIRCRR